MCCKANVKLRFGPCLSSLSISSTPLHFCSYSVPSPTLSGKVASCIYLFSSFTGLFFNTTCSLVSSRLCSAFSSVPSHACTVVNVYFMRASPSKRRVCEVLFPSVGFQHILHTFIFRLHTFILLCWCASPRKHRVCAVLFFCTRIFVMLVCFASQTSGLCSAFRLHTFILLCWCASPRKHRVCAVLSFCTRLFVVSVLRLAHFRFVQCFPSFFEHVYPQVAQAPKGAVNI